MPINYLEIKQQLPAFCQKMELRQQQLVSFKQQALDELNRFSENQADLAERILAESRKNQMLRCAIPGPEPMNQAYTAVSSIFPGTILAADGSQVIPSRHHQIQFGALNIAAVILSPGSNQAPEICTRSKLLEPDEMGEGDAPASEAYIALLRDLEERKLSAELAQQYQTPVVTLTDGGLELFREPRASKQYDQVLEKYIQVLEELSTRQVVYAGYVDKPGSSLVVNMLDILAGDGSQSNLSSGLIDRILFAGILPKPGSRSAMFGIQSQQSAKFSGNLSIHFFYLNVGRAEQPQIVRVEIPGWVSEQPELVGMLQQVLLEQCASSGSKPFPYLIHRAHEEAVIQFEDADQLEAMIINTMMDNHIPFGEKSGKQALKDLPGKKRMGK